MSGKRKTRKIHNWLLIAKHLTYGHHLCTWAPGYSLFIRPFCLSTWGWSERLHLCTNYPPLRLLRWLSGKQSTCQCRKPGFCLWVGKIPWRREWQPTPTFLPGKSHGQRSQMGCSPWGRERVGYNLVTKQQQPTVHLLLYTSLWFLLSFSSLPHGEKWSRKFLEIQWL